MATKIAPYVRFDVSELPVGASRGGIVGLDVSREPKPLVFRGNVSTEIEGFSERYQGVRKGSITAGEAVALWNLYLSRDLGKTEPTEEQMGVLKYLFNNRGRGNVCDNAVNYNDHGKLTEKEGFSRAAVITRPDGFRFNDETSLWEPVLGEDSEVVRLHLPKTGYVRRTNDGLYHPSGFPFDTSPTRTEAEKSLTDVGFSPKFAKLAVSYFYSRSEDSGTVAVDRRFWYDDYGRFLLLANRNPDNRYDSVGRLAVSR